MQWLPWLIPLVVLAVWILAQLTANKQTPRNPLRPPPLPDSDEDQRQRRTKEDLNSFLEEVKRRKQEAEAERKTQRESASESIPMAEEAPLARKPPPLPRPREPQRPEPRRKSVAVGSKKPPKRYDEPVIVLQPVPVSDPVPISRTIEMPTSIPGMAPPLPVAPRISGSPQPVIRPDAIPARARTSGAVKMVRRLLRNRQSLGAAFLLKEVLDAPRCKRPRHRGHGRPVS